MEFNGRDSENKEEARFISSNLPESSEVNGSDPGFARSAAPMSVCFQGRRGCPDHQETLAGVEKPAENVTKFEIWGYEMIYLGILDDISVKKFWGYFGDDIR